MRAIAAITTRIGGSATIIQFNVQHDGLKHVVLSVEQMKQELERTWFNAPKTCSDWQTITFTMEREPVKPVAEDDFNPNLAGLHEWLLHTAASHASGIAANDPVMKAHIETLTRWANLLREANLDAL